MTCASATCGEPFTTSFQRFTDTTLSVALRFERQHALRPLFPETYVAHRYTRGTQILKCCFPRAREPPATRTCWHRRRTPVGSRDGSFRRTLKGAKAKFRARPAPRPGSAHTESLSAAPATMPSTTPSQTWYLRTWSCKYPPVFPMNTHTHCELRKGTTWLTPIQLLHDICLAIFLFYFFRFLLKNLTRSIGF